MSTWLGLMYIILSIVLSILLSKKVNFGIMAMFFAFVLGYWCCGLTLADILSYFPTRTIVIFIIYTIFFGYVRRGQIFNNISMNIMYSFRKRPALVPFAIYLSAITVNGLCNGTAAFAIVGPIGYAIAAQAGFAPVIVAFALTAGAGINFPWSMGGPIHQGILSQYVSSQAVEKGLIYILEANLLISTIGFIVVYLAARGYKPKNRTLDFRKSEPLTGKQKRILYVVLAVLSLVVIPSVTEMLAPNPVTAWITAKIDTQIIFLAGSVALAFMEIEKADTVIREDVPWSVILMIAGTSMLVGLMNDFHIIGMLTEWITASISPFWIIPILLAVAGLMTMVSNGITVIYALAPIVFSVSAQYVGVPFLGAYTAAYVGTQTPSCSPFSYGGAMAMVSATENTDREKLFKQLLLVSICMMLLQVLIVCTGIFNLMQ